MQRSSKLYRNFRAVCGISSFDEKNAADLIERSGRHVSGIRVHNPETDMTFRIKTVSQRENGERLMELYEIHGKTHANKTKLIFRDWIILKLPRQSPAVTDMLGVMMLIGIASAGAAGFYMVAVDLAERVEYYIEFRRFDLTTFADPASQGVAEIELFTNRPYSVVVSGGIHPIHLTDADGGPLGGAVLAQGSSGTSIRYEGTVVLARPGWDGSYLTVKAENDLTDTVQAVRVGVL